LFCPEILKELSASERAEGENIEVFYILLSGADGKSSRNYFREEDYIGRGRFILEGEDNPEGFTCKAFR